MRGGVPEVGRFGPFSALPAGLSGIAPEDAGLGKVDLLAPGLALLVMMAWIGATFAAGFGLLRRRDVHWACVSSRAWEPGSSSPATLRRSSAPAT
jgi:hypothetical protein